MRYIVGDIGGTNIRLADAVWAGGHFELQHERVIPSRDHDGLDEVLAEYAARSRADSACLGVAGPVNDNVCRTTNLPWLLDGAALAKASGLRQVRLVNDLEAAAWGLDALEEDDYVVLHAGEPVARANQSVVAAGTGLGEAARVWCGAGYRPLGSEGSHADFAPATELDFSLLQWLANRYGAHVSWERVVSGPGLVDLHAFLREAGGRPVPRWLVQAMEENDPAAAIATAAQGERDPVCIEALDLFIRHFGREAGNHALKLMSLGGVYLTGGIAPKLSSRFAEAGFLDAFWDKGRMRELMRRMPVYLVVNENLALYGAACCARAAGLGR